MFTVLSPRSLLDLALDTIDPLATDLSGWEPRKHVCIGSDSRVAVFTSKSDYILVLSLPGAVKLDVSTNKKRIVVNAVIDPIDSVPEGYDRVNGALQGSELNQEFAVASDANLDEMKADYKDGILTLTIPRDEAAQPRKVQVRWDRTEEEK